MLKAVSTEFGGSGGSGITFTDGTHTVSSATQLTVTGATVGGTSPNATLTITPGGISIGDAVTGGTAGSVLFVNSSGNLDQNNAKFFWDDTNGVLGIGTNTPHSIDTYARLVVYGSDSLVCSMRLQNAGSGQTQFYIKNATGAQFGLGMLGGNPYLYITNTAGTTQMVIRHDSVGVSVGDTNPSGASQFESYASSTTVGGIGIFSKASNTANMMTFNIGGSTVAYFDKYGAWSPPTLADATATNDTIYLSSGSGSLSYKDGSGTTKTFAFV